MSALYPRQILDIQDGNERAALILQHKMVEL